MEPESKIVGSEATGGCGMKRKAEETEEASTVDVAVVGQSERVVLMRQDVGEVENVVYAYEDDSDVVDPKEDPEIVFERIREKFEARARESEEEAVYEDHSDEFDSEEDPEISFAKIVAKFDAHMRELEALYSDVTYGDCTLDEAGLP